MFELTNARNAIMVAFIPYIPVDTGQLKNLFYDEGYYENGDTIGVDMMKNPLIYYGFILNNSPTIRRALKRQGYIYSYRVTPNKHFRFIDKFFEGEAITIFENRLGVKRIS